MGGHVRKGEHGSLVVYANRLTRTETDAATGEEIEKEIPYLNASLAHECTHWTRHPSRLDRDLGRKQWGDAGYAKEELVAELGSAYLCADLGITPEVRDDHAAYIASWLKALNDDQRLIFTAAAHAQRAVDFLHGLQPAPTPEPEPAPADRDALQRRGAPPSSDPAP